MAPNQPRRKRDRFREFLSLKKKDTSGNTPSNEANSTHVVLSSRGSTITADDVGRSTPSRNEGSTAHVDIAEVPVEDCVPSNDDGRSTSNHNEEPSVTQSGAHADTAQPSAATSIPSSDAGQATPSREEGTSAAQSGSNVDPTPAVAEGTGAAGDATEEVASLTKEKGKFAPYLSASAWIAGSVSQLSDAIPPLKLTMDILKVILENASTMEENKDAAADLCARIKRLLERVHDERADPSKLHVVALTKSLTKINQELGQIGGLTEGHQGLSDRFKQFVFASRNKSRIDSFIASVDRALLDYQISLTHKLYELKLDEMGKGSTISYRESRGSFYLFLDDRNTLNNMKPVSEAMFDASDTRTPCLPGTRVDILHTLEGWAADPTARQVYWLNGHAGSGKSTIAQSLAERLFAQGQLGASFFCSRNSQETSDLRAIFRTIAFQLARTANGQSETYRKSLLEAMSTQANPDVATYSLNEQLKYLILEPATQSGINTVVIIDALDECIDDKSTSAILNLLSQHAARLPHLKVKFFITSRPESHIRAAFRLTPLEELTDVMVIHKVAADSINQDIRLFLDHNFLRIAKPRSDFDVTEIWPEPKEVNTLVIASAGLFIFAATIIKYIDARHEDPKARLNEIINFKEFRALASDTSPSAHPFDELDKLYLQVLKQSSAGNNMDKEARKAILGLVVVACAPVSIATIAGILNLDPGKVRNLVRPLHSVLLVPAEDTNPLSLHHKSFADFLVDSGRCEATEFLIMEDDHHRSTALHCLDFMKGGLKKNICGLSRYSMNSDLLVEPGKLDECIGNTLRYCCQYWARHLTSDCARDHHFSEAQPQLEYLLTNQMLMWVEVLSLIGDLPSTVHSLIMLKEWLTTLQASDAARMFLDWVQDGHRLVLFAFDIISLSVSHIYHSALVFAPEQSLLKQAHAADLTAEARLLIGATAGWEGPLRTIDMVRNPDTLEFSHDGSMLAVGGRQWDCCIVHPSTGTRMCSFEAEFEKHGLPSTSLVTSVSFSADNQILAMSFYGSPFLVLLYDIHTGLSSAQHLDTGHTAYNNLTVAFCPLSRHSPLLLIGPQEGTGSDLQLYLWDTSSGTLGDSEGRPNCDKLSLDRGSAWCWLHGDQATPQIAVGLSDGSIEIRSVAPSQSPALLARSHSALFASPIVSMASSQDGTKMVAISAGGELSLFTTQTHQSGTRLITHILSFPKKLHLSYTNKSSTPPKLYFIQESHTLVIGGPRRLRAFRLDCSGSQAGVEEIGLSILNSELHRGDAVAFSSDGQYIAYNCNIASLSTAIPSMLQHHKDSLRTVGAPEPESHYPILYCDGQMVITDKYIWDITKHERRYSCGNEIGEMSSAFTVKDDIILSCNWRGDVTLWDPSRERPVIKRWADVLNHGGQLHVYSYTTSTIRFLSYPQAFGKNEPMDIKLWAITSTDTPSPPHGSTTTGDSGPRLYQIAAGQIPAHRNIRSVYHEYLADSNGEEAVFYLEAPIDGQRYRGVHKQSAAQATDSEPLVEEDGSGPVHIEFEEIPCVWEDESAEYPIAGDGLFRMLGDPRWVLDSRRRKRLWLPPAYTSARPGELRPPEELRCTHGSTFVILDGTYLKALVNFSSVNLDDSVPF
ncbi:hypothetical protein BC629DRAFT_1599649 [Irpex lacteus]|nr:hypothetical protein BC629DRAFT_1599649 [Irpex lacteus]